MRKLPSANLFATEVRKVASKIVDQEFEILVALPHSYTDKTAKEKKYPTIFLLDAYWRFGTVCEMTRTMANCGASPEVIVVGVGYPINHDLKRPMKELEGLRNRDLTPIIDKEWEKKSKELMAMDPVDTGGAKHFLQFLHKELMPIMAAEYRIDNSKRVLAGHSFGGLFTLYTLFHQPELFQGYLAASPSLWYGKKHMFVIENEYANNHNDLHANLYMCIGENEETKEIGMVSDLFRFSALLASRKYKNLTMTHQFFDGLNHCETIGPGFQFGFKWLLAKGIS